MYFRPFWPSLFPKVRITKIGDARKVFNRFWYKIRRVDFEWSIPMRSEYVERYFLQYLAFYKGFAKQRRYYVLSWMPWHLADRPLWKKQNQVMIKPIAGVLTDYDDYKALALIVGDEQIELTSDGVTS